MADADRMPMSSFPGVFLLVESGHCHPRSLCQRCRTPAHRAGMYQSEDHSVKAAHLDITTCNNLVPYVWDVREMWELSSLVIDSVDEDLRFYEISELNNNQNASIDPRSDNWIRRRSG